MKVWDGSQWVDTDNAGLIIDLKHVLKTDTFSASVASGASVDVTDLSITHEVASASNKLIISAFFGMAGTTQGRTAVGLALHDGTSLIAIGDAAGARSRITAGGQSGRDVSGANVAKPSVTFVHTPGSGSKTYTVRAINLSTGTETLFINRDQDNSDVVDRPRSVSSLVIQEVAV